MTHKVTLRPSGHAFEVEDGEAVLDAALRAGSSLPYGCRNGNCGACLGKVLSGRAHYPGERPGGVTEAEAASGQLLLCQAVPDTDLEVEVREIERAAEVPVKTLPCRVVGMQKLAADVMRLYLKLPANERLQFLAGQYIDILLRDGRRRGFSLANAPAADDTLELHIRHVPGGEFTTAVFEQMREKALLRFQGPLGTFYLRETSSRPAILMGGGTGFAPLKGMLEHAFQAGTTRPLHLYWGVRSRADLYLNDLAEAWAEKHANFSYTPVLSEPAPEDGWSGRTGWVHDAVLADYPSLVAHEVYMSGPPPMIKAARAGFAAAGLPAEHLYFDSFEFASDHPDQTA